MHAQLLLHSFRRHTVATVALLALALSLVAATAAMAATPVAAQAATTKTKTVKLVAVGDNMIHQAVLDAAKKPSGGYDFSSIYANVSDDIKGADIASINQESIFVKRNYSGWPRFATPYKVGRTLVKAGFDVVQQANNHVMDQGARAALNTAKWWHETYPSMKVLGIHYSKKDANTIRIIKRNGIKIALLCYAHGTNGNKVPDSKSYLVDMLRKSNRANIANDIKRAKKMADFVIVYAHMGSEYTYKPSEKTTAWAKWFANRGVDLLIGTHPHVVQPVKYVYSKSKKHKMLCYYSLGNFVSKSTRKPHVESLLGGMAKVTIEKTSKTSKARIKSYKFVPLVTQKGVPGKSGFTVYKLADYTTTLAKNNAFHEEYGSKISVTFFRNKWKSITGRSVQR